MSKHLAIVVLTLFAAPLFANEQQLAIVEEAFPALDNDFRDSWALTETTSSDDGVRHRALRSARRAIELLVVGREKDFQRRHIQPPFSVAQPERAFELGCDAVIVDDVHLLDQPVEAEPHGRVANAVGFGQFLKRTEASRKRFRNVRPSFVNLVSKESTIAHNTR